MNKYPVSIRPYLEEIAQCLWSKNASIMVGAGFSMNADAIFDNAKRFPSWQDLGNIFYQKVRGEGIKDAKYNFFDPLKLAYEVEANFGRSVLDSILRANIPDSDYKPSKLHHSLLSLPWTDVFTTNYDTLLERGSDTVSERNYKVVVNKDDLVHSVSPRIVKLHGCFSASTPLIISEEDYRVYPKKYAPFVNTVQQTLLENTLCLIGFSGDDPNFLKWIGWIRDNLGAQNAPKIYLLGVLNLSTSQEKTLANYNITCVDMSLCDEVGENDHQAGITAFVDYCQSKKDGANTNSWELSHEFKRPEKLNKNGVTLDEITEELEQLLNLWKVERTSYPNWKITPNDKRESLWRHTEKWSLVFNKELKLNEALLSTFVYEFLWRKEKSLIPIFDNEVKLIKQSIFYDDDNRKIVKSGEESFFIFGALLRYYREEGKIENWKQLFRHADEAFTVSFANDFLIYENALLFLFENDIKELTLLLANWKVSSAHWMYRKASILSETNNLFEAKELLEKALIKTRKKINSSVFLTDYSNVSLESYILLLLTMVKRSILYEKGDYSENKNPFKERFDELKEFQCNPWQELEMLSLNIKHEPVKFESQKTNSCFDIGRRHTTLFFSNSNDEVINAFKYLRFFEDAGFPLSLPHINFGGEGGRSAIKRIALYAPYWTVTTMLRSEDQKSIDLIFTRESLKQFDSEFIDNLTVRYTKLFTSYVSNQNDLYEYGKVLPEALSRLCCRCSLDNKDSILKLILTIYKSKPTRFKYANVDKLVNRLINSYNEKQLLQRVSHIVAISFCLIENEKIDSLSFPNPFNYLFNLNCTKQSKEINYKLPVDIIREFINKVESDSQSIREISTLTLIKLDQLGFLNKNQVKSLLSKLLSKVDEYGLPKNTLFKKFAFIEIFDYRKEIIESVKKYLLETKPEAQARVDNPMAFSITSEASEYTQELSGGGSLIEWSRSELDIVTRKLLDWWEADKGYFINKHRQGEVNNEMEKRFSYFINCIDLVVIKNNLTEYQKDISRLVSEFEQMGLMHLHFKSVTRSYLKIASHKFIAEVESGLSSFDERITLDALLAIKVNIQKNRSIEFEILSAFSNFIRYTCNLFLISSFNIVIIMLNESHDSFNQSVENSVLEALKKVDKGFDGLSFDENLELRVSAATLAYQLNIYYKSLGVVLPRIISDWKIICASDSEFSEVRNKWKSEG